MHGHTLLWDAVEADYKGGFLFDSKERFGNAWPQAALGWRELSIQSMKAIFQGASSLGIVLPPSLDIFSGVVLG